MAILDAAVWCRGCKLRITRATLPDDSSGLVALEHAIAAWNRRALTLPPVGDVRAAAKVRADELFADANWLICSAVSVERAAVAMWREEAIRAQVPEGVIKRRTHDAFLNEHPDTRNRWLGLANAACRALAQKE
ncbi:MAG: hypothetical protein DI533_00530 [Cereibacter sphaeroides]|uniref:Uncharacterized protein n=1 Tax=Cereibacter sphaeroides TaxID=1063 RepID=A0A2W5S8D0_CERSP|nr:MAG: hypothetical protein DI533_00530 [Cereibacter sphaeroides]